MVSRINLIIVSCLILAPWNAFSLPELRAEWLKCDKDSDCGTANSGCAKWVAVNKRFIVRYAGAKGYPKQEGVPHSDACLNSSASAVPPKVSCVNGTCQIR